MHELFGRRIAEICDGDRPHPSRETKTLEELARWALAIAECEALFENGKCRRAVPQMAAFGE
jgi:hypothetical protein